MKVFVTGGTGFIGQHLVNKLNSCGHEVYCLVRPESLDRIQPEGSIRIVPGNLNQPESYRHVVKQCSLIFHVAGVTKALDQSGYFLGNHQATVNLLEAAGSDAANRKRFILVSSQAAAGPSTDNGFDETNNPAPVSGYGRSKLAAEQAVKKREDMDWVILRPSVVFGPADREMLPLFKAAKSGIIPSAGFRDFPVNFIYIDDLIQAIMLAAENCRTTGDTYFINDGKASSWETMNGVIRSQVNRRAIILPIALPVLRTVCSFSGFMAKVRGKAAYMNPDKWHEIKQAGWLCSGRRFHDATGFSARWSLDQGVAATARWYRSQGWLG